MSAKRLYYIPVAIALVALLTLAGRSAFAAVASHATTDAAKQAESLDLDSATRSYTAWAKAVEEQQNGQIDSATRSYMAWAKAIEEEQSNAADDRAEAIRLVQARLAWAKAFEQQRTASQPTAVP